MHKRCLFLGCVWMGVYVGGNWTICLLLWVRKRWVKMRNNLPCTSIFQGWGGGDGMCSHKTQHNSRNYKAKVHIHQHYSKGLLSCVLGLRNQWDSNYPRRFWILPSCCKMSPSGYIKHILMFPSARSKQETANDALKILLQKTADPCEVLHTNLTEETELNYRESRVQFRRTIPHLMTTIGWRNLMNGTQKPTSRCLIYK